MKWSTWFFFRELLKRFLESANWTYLDAIDSGFSAKRRRTCWRSCFGVPAWQIGTIPRYELLAPAREQRPFPARSEPFTLVFSGRLSPTKNIEMLLKTTAFLQTVQKVPVELALFGSFDNELHVDHEPPPEGERLTDYRERVLQCIDELEWTARPRIIHGCGPDDWYRQKLVNPVLVSLSTFLGEDFGVSVAQAQALGWPCLISDWGAHRDVRALAFGKLPGGPHRRARAQGTGDAKGAAARFRDPWPFRRPGQNAC